MINQLMGMVGTGKDGSGNGKQTGITTPGFHPGEKVKESHLLAAHSDSGSKTGPANGGKLNLGVSLKEKMLSEDQKSQTHLPTHIRDLDDKDFKEI